ncbi:MAG TPA: DUF2142 domain-containing protein [Solirubrobacteraceae bacterium]|nr:DUF2142 domain-containing protein [Solirubrobacteraceae bacterium]
MPALAGGLALLALAIAATLSRTPLVVAGTNAVAPTRAVGATRGPIGACQGGETIPAGTSAVRMWVTSNVKPRVTVAIREGARTVAAGAAEGGRLGKVAAVGIAPLPRTLHDAELCFGVGRGAQQTTFYGGASPHPQPGEEPSKMTVEYLRPGAATWWSLAGTVAKRLGMGRAPAGRWTGLVPLSAMVLATLLAAWTALTQLRPARRGRLQPAPPIAGAQAVGQPRSDLAEAAAEAMPARRRGADPRRRRARPRRVPAAACACAAVATLSAVSWSFLTPPFQAPDEPSHFAYTQILAETGALPRTSTSSYSPEENVVLTDLDHQAVRFNVAIGTISSAAQQRRLEHDMGLALSRVGEGAGVASPQPPLYYALQTIPYFAGSGGTLLDRLALMRLLSALMAGVTALFVFLFLREALPAAPFAWTVGGLCAALAPLLGYVSGIVNPDALLCAVAAALFFGLARGFRRGLTPGLAIALGALTAAGFLSKLNFLGLAPGVLLALLLIGRRTARGTGRRGYRWAALAAGIGLAPPAAYALVNVLSGHPAFGLLSAGVSGTTAHHGSPLQELGYVFQLYLFRLPGTPAYFPGLLPLRLWFEKLVGAYGWLDTYFAEWVYVLAAALALPIVALCLREAVRARGALRARLDELAAYAAIAVGLLALIGADSYLELPKYAGSYSEPRYLLPFAALFAAVFALAARGAGRRWGPAVGTLLIVLVLGHDIFSQLLVVSRFYF